MRSSIACVRCRRSKVKCVNTGPNTTCKACETTNRECTYPQPVQGGTPRGGGGAGGGAVGGGNVMSAVTVGGLGGHHSGGGSGERSEQAPKKQKPKKAPSVNAAPTSSMMNTPKGWKECLESPVLTRSVWEEIFECFQRHHSPLLPFLHPPTFLNRLRASAPSTTSSGSSPPAPEKPHSPLLLLGMLALTARHISTLVTHYSPALPTPVTVSEFYANALKHRLRNDEEDDLLSPSLEKVQALLMLCVHEWGGNNREATYMWLGIAIRMSGRLGLSWVEMEEAQNTAGSTSPELDSGDGPSVKRRKLGNGTSLNASKPSTASAVEKEAKRRTFWSVFLLDRAFSWGRFFPSQVSSEDAGRVQLPCDERGFSFGTYRSGGWLQSERLLKPIRNGGVAAAESGGEERILAQIVKAMEIFGKIQAWADISDASPITPSSPYHSLSTALDTFSTSLPPQLEFSLETLQVHTSTQSSSSYTVLHTLLFLARITLELPHLPSLPLLSPSPLGPSDSPHSPSTEQSNFFTSSATRLFTAARDFISLLDALKEWNSWIEHPLLITAISSAASLGLYAYSFPWMDPHGILTGATPLGTGEEARRSVEFICSLKHRFVQADTTFHNLVKRTLYFSDQKDAFLSSPPPPISPNDQKFHIPVNTEAKTRILTMLSPATPKPAPVHIQHRQSISEPELLNPEPAVQPQSDRWMAVNKLPAAGTPITVPPQQSQIVQSSPATQHIRHPSDTSNSSHLDTLTYAAATHAARHEGHGGNRARTESLSGGGPPVLGLGNRARTESIGEQRTGDVVMKDGEERKNLLPPLTFVNQTVNTGPGGGMMQGSSRNGQRSPSANGKTNGNGNGNGWGAVGSVEG